MKWNIKEHVHNQKANFDKSQTLLILSFPLFVLNSSPVDRVHIDDWNFFLLGTFFVVALDDERFFRLCIW